MLNSNLIAFFCRLQNQHKNKAAEQTIPATATPTTAVITTTPAAAAAVMPLTIRHLKVDSPLLQEHKAAITIGIIMGIFLLCWYIFLKSVSTLIQILVIS